jgi:hypothetical protein
MQTPVPNIPKELVQGLAKAKVRIDLAFIEPLSERFTVVATVIDKETGTQHVYPIEVTATAHTVH